MSTNCIHCVVNERTGSDLLCEGCRLKKDIARKAVLLRAAYDLLTVALDSHYVKEASSILVHYDETECDGMCLREDIAHELGIDPETAPIPTITHHNE